MATNDLCNALAKDVKMDEAMEKKICSAILKELDDKSNDVQSVAVKCLGVLLKKVQTNQVSEICIKLCSLVIEGQDALRDIYSIGVKTLISDVPDTMGDVVVDRLTARLLNGISRVENDDVKRECLDNLNDLIRRFGHLLKKDHEEILAVVTAQLNHAKPFIRKRAAACLGTLAVVSNNALLFKMVEDLLAKVEALENSKKSSGYMISIVTLIQTIGIISKTVGFRLGRHLDRLIPLFTKICGEPDDENLQNEEGNDLREHSFPGLESFVLRCPREVTPHIESILQLSLKFLKYDPNYCYDEEGEGDEDVMEDDVEEEDAEEYEDVDDDDDTSWKVRKAAVKVIGAIVSVRQEVLNDSLFSVIAKELVSRFKEREESVRIEVFNCFTALIQVAISQQVTLNRFPSGNLPAAELSRDDSNSANLMNPYSPRTSAQALPPLAAPKLSLQRTSTFPAHISGSVLVSPLCQYLKLNYIIKSCRKHLKSGSLKTKSAVYVMLRVLVDFLQGGLDDHLSNLVKDIVLCVETEKNQTVKLDALQCIRQFLVNHRKHVTQKYMAAILPVVIKASKEEWYKIISESLKLLGIIIRIVRNRDPSRMEVVAKEEFNITPYISAIYEAILPRLEALDIDHEIKEGAIKSASLMISELGDLLSLEQFDTLATLIHKRLDNEVTRLSALKAISTVAATNLNVNISKLIAATASDIPNFLRQHNRTLRQATLSTIIAIMEYKNSNVDVPIKTACNILHEVSILLSNSDISSTDLSLKVIECIIKQFGIIDGEIITTLRIDVLPKSTELATSSLLHGTAQDSLVGLLQVFAQSNENELRYEDLVKTLISKGEPQGGNSLPKQGLSNLAKCIAGICFSASEAHRNSTISNFTQDISDNVEWKKQLSLLCIGYLGQRLDITTVCAVATLRDLLLQCFEDSTEDIKSATAFALGNIAVRNMETFLPVLLQESSSTKHKYLLLVALKETISVHLSSRQSFDQYLDLVLPQLLSQAVSEEEGVRNMVAECLGILATMHTHKVLMLLLRASENTEDKRALWTVATSLRHAFSRFDPMLVSTISIEPFVSIIKDNDLEVRKASLLMVNAAVHYTPGLIADCMSEEISPRILETLVFKQERVVDLGPFKHKVDDGLPLRKAALTCCESILIAIPETIDSVVLMNQLVLMLAENKEELNLHCHQVIGKLCTKSPTSVLFKLDDLVDPLEKAITKSLPKETAAGKEGAGPEADRGLEQLRSCLRLVVSVNAIENASMNRKWVDFLDRIQKKPVVADTLSDIVAHESAEGTF